MRSIVESTTEFEAWLQSLSPPLFEDHLDHKHKKMAAGRFAFLRGSFYRWAELWSRHAHDLHGHNLNQEDVPVILGVGDLHLENFGTWRSRTGHLIWGINDFDEACRLPYTSDLVRLATSARITPEIHHLTLSPKEACQALLEGYHHSLAVGGNPFILGQCSRSLVKMALSALQEPQEFWQEEEDDLRKAENRMSRSELSPDVMAALELPLRERGLHYEVGRRRAGLGSLGRPRYLAISESNGGKAAFEVKALAPSAWLWAQHSVDRTMFYQEVLSGAVRSPDPHQRIYGSQWVVRALAPYAGKIELQKVDIQQGWELLYAMGWETANVHLGNRAAVEAIRSHIKALSKDWLVEAAERMAELITVDHAEWRRHVRP